MIVLFCTRQEKSCFNKHTLRRKWIDRRRFCCAVVTPVSVVNSALPGSAFLLFFCPSALFSCKNLPRPSDTRARHTAVRDWRHGCGKSCREFLREILSAYGSNDRIGWDPVRSVLVWSGPVRCDAMRCGAVRCCTVLKGTQYSNVLQHCTDSRGG
ncbi:hypothetical protein Mapa_002741 [Marchantia paleacea]|nr:hypothetical protein Mapa_002741 [Marchantia paleacea]